MNRFDSLPDHLQEHIHHLATKCAFDSVLSTLPEESLYKKTVWKTKRNHVAVVNEIRSLSKFIQTYSVIVNIGKKYLKHLVNNMDKLDLVTRQDYFMWFIYFAIIYDGANNSYDTLIDTFDTYLIHNIVDYIHAKIIDEFYSLQEQAFC